MWYGASYIRPGALRQQPVIWHPDKAAVAFKRTINSSDLKLLSPLLGEELLCYAAFRVP